MAIKFEDKAEAEKSKLAKPVATKAAPEPPAPTTGAPMPEATLPFGKPVKADKKKRGR